MSEKEQEAHKAIKKYIWWSAGVSMLPWVCVDMYAVGAVQLKMLADISKIYEVPFLKNIGKAAIASLGGFARNCIRKSIKPFQDCSDSGHHGRQSSCSSALCRLHLGAGKHIHPTL